MAALNVAVVFRPDGEIAMVVVPDEDRQLDDPAFNPDEHTQVRVSRQEYVSLFSDADGRPALDKIEDGLVDRLEGELAERVRQRIAIRKQREADRAAEIAAQEAEREEAERAALDGELRP